MITCVNFDLFCFIANGTGLSNNALYKLFEYYLELDSDLGTDNEVKIDSYTLTKWVEYKDLASLVSDNMFLREQIELKGIESDTDIIELISDYTRLIVFMVDDKNHYILDTDF